MINTKWKTNLGLIEVFHPHTVNRGTQTSGAIGLSDMHRPKAEKQEEAQHLAPITLLYFITLSKIFVSGKKRATPSYLNNIIQLWGWHHIIEMAQIEENADKHFISKNKFLLVLYCWHYVATSNKPQLSRETWLAGGNHLYGQHVFRNPFKYYYLKFITRLRTKLIGLIRYQCRCPNIAFSRHEKWDEQEGILPIWSCSRFLPV